MRVGSVFTVALVALWRVFVIGCLRVTGLGGGGYGGRVVVGGGRVGVVDAYTNVGVWTASGHCSGKMPVP